MKKTSLFITFMIFLNCMFAETVWNIDFYGVSSNDLDKNMASMTSDLYYTQLCEIKNFSVTDKRSSIEENTIPDHSVLSDSNLSFYSVIAKKEDSSKWTATLHIVNKDKNTEMTSTKEFDSYYKILMEGKQELQESFISLIQQDNNQPSETPKTQEYSSKTSVAASTENLAGSWTGENNIEKVLIMRGGRGFVIFKNGASMNISVKVDDSTVIVSQTGKPNASFFPDLPRQQALEAALTAKPITWKLKLAADNILTGKKNTIIAVGDNITSGELDVEWTRKP